MPSTSAPGLRMEKAIVGVAPCTLFGVPGLAAQEEQTFKAKSRTVCARDSPGHTVMPIHVDITFMNFVDQRTWESLCCDSRQWAVGLWPKRRRI
jgi:hypothetical protein